MLDKKRVVPLSNKSQALNYKWSFFDCEIIFYEPVKVMTQLLEEERKLSHLAELSTIMSGLNLENRSTI